ncbi:MAG: ATP synthase A1 subunit C [Candidatus Woesearchaeota archaeon]
MSEKIILADCYPYTYVRVISMKSKLLSRDDYNKLLKMGFSEISKYLQESEYKKEINELGMELKGADLLESALNKNLITSFDKLWRISPDELDLLINAYVKRYDFFNVKTIIRAKFSKLKTEDIKKTILPIGLFSSKHMQKMIDEESINKIIEICGLLENKKIPQIIQRFKDSSSLLEIENALDEAYFNFVFEFSKKIPEEGQLFKKFLLNEIDVLNIKLLLRLKKANMKHEDIAKHISMYGEELSLSRLKRLIKADYKGAIKILEKTSFKEIIKRHAPALESSKSLVRLENDLDKYLLKKSLSLLHQHPLSIDIILGYMFAKEIEVKNLKAIVKGKQLRMDEDFIAGQLIA